MEQKYITKNGVAVYSYSNESLHSFCISAYVKFGCVYESAEEAGISHMFEHMAFRSIKQMYEGNLHKILDKCGLDFNATTYSEFIQFYITGATTHFDLAAEIITKILHPISVNACDFETEKKRIKAEIHEEDYKTSLECFSNSVVWEGTSQVGSICGTCSSVDKISRVKLQEFQKNIVNHNNIFFYVTGNVSNENLEKLNSEINQYTVGNGVKFDNLVEVPKHFGNRSCEVYLKNSTYSIVRFSFDVETIKYSNAALTLFFDVLFSGDSCILFQNLSEKSGLVYGYDARFTKYNNIGNMYFTYEVKTNKVEETVRVVIESLKSLKNGVGDRLQYVKAPYVDNAMILFDNSEDFNWNRAYENHILNCNYPDVESRIRAFSEIKDTHIEEIACDVLKCDNLVLAMKSNKKKIDLDKVRSIIREL